MLKIDGFLSAEVFSAEVRGGEVVRSRLISTSLTCKQNPNKASLTVHYVIENQEKLDAYLKNNQTQISKQGFAFFFLKRLSWKSKS